MIQEKEVSLRQRLCIRLPVRCYVTSNNHIKILDLMVKLFESPNQTANKKKQRSENEIKSKSEHSASTED